MEAVSPDYVNPEGATATGAGTKRPNPRALNTENKVQKQSRKKRKESKVVYESPVTGIIHTDAANFRMLVQELTSAKSRTPSPAPSPMPSPSPALSASPMSSPPPDFPTQSTGSKTNQRLRNLAPPPLAPPLIRPTVINATAVGFRPVPPRSSTPGSQPTSQPASDSAEAASTLPSLGSSRGMPQFPFGLPGSPYPMFSPHFLSPLPILSPRDMFGGSLDSPGSVQMREMAMMAMAAMSGLDSNGMATPRQDSFPPNPAAGPSPTHVHPMLHPQYGMFPAFAAGFAIGPSMASTMGVVPNQVAPAAPVASPPGP